MIKDAKDAQVFACLSVRGVTIMATELRCLTYNIQSILQRVLPSTSANFSCRIILSSLTYYHEHQTTIYGPPYQAQSNRSALILLGYMHPL